MVLQTRIPISASLSASLSTASIKHVTVPPTSQQIGPPVVSRTVSCPTDLSKDAQSRSLSARRQISGETRPIASPGPSSVPVAIATLMDPIPHRQITPRHLSPVTGLVSPRTANESLCFLPRESATEFNFLARESGSELPSPLIEERRPLQPPESRTRRLGPGLQSPRLRVARSQQASSRTIKAVAGDAKVMDPQDDDMLKGLAEATRTLKSVMSGISHSVEMSPRDSPSIQGLEARIRGLEEKFTAVTNAFEKTFQMCEALEYTHSQKVVEIRANIKQDIETTIDDKLSGFMLELVDRDLLAPIQETFRKSDARDDLLNSVKELRIEGMLNMVADRVMERISPGGRLSQAEKEQQASGGLPTFALSQDKLGHNTLPASWKESCSSSQDVGRQSLDCAGSQFCDTVSHDVSREPILEDAQEDVQDDVALESVSTWQCNLSDIGDQRECVS